MAHKHSQPAARMRRGAARQPAFNRQFLEARPPIAVLRTRLALWVAGDRGAPFPAPLCPAGPGLRSPASTVCRLWFRGLLSAFL